MLIKEDRSAQQRGITFCIRCCKQDITHFLEGRSYFISICAGYCTVCLLLCGKRIVNTDAVQIIRASAVRCRDNCQLHFVFPVLICCKRCCRNLIVVTGHCLVVNQQRLCQDRSLCGISVRVHIFIYLHAHISGLHVGAAVNVNACTSKGKGCFRCAFLGVCIMGSAVAVCCVIRKICILPSAMDRIVRCLFISGCGSVSLPCSRVFNAHFTG